MLEGTVVMQVRGAKQVMLRPGRTFYERPTTCISCSWVVPSSKAFNTMNYKHLLELGRPAGTPGRLALPVAGDDPRAKQAVLRLIDELESTLVVWTIRGASNPARPSMTTILTARACGTHWLSAKRAHSAVAADREQSRQLRPTCLKAARTKGRFVY